MPDKLVVTAQACGYTDPQGPLMQTEYSYPHTYNCKLAVVSDNHLTFLEIEGIKTTKNAAVRILRKEVN